ncbi:hypothetical protein NH398_11655 [Halomonas sp. CnH100-B]|uniref:hypothetical protein n=1 Tax=Halomonas sp. CnH100-B TaxID=2954490 RepID=UPI002097AB54|nr:hypothetical protein [Halomonas sp. CnH100-B]MCO7229880.1 hypothetical protein [Halomonas sp. CnH100-B]
MKRPFDWIVLEDAEQVDWIANYLARKNIAGELSFFLMDIINRLGGPETVKLLKNYSNDDGFYKISAQIENAWRVHKHRQKKGRPVSIQVSEMAQNQLKVLAKKNGQSQVETLDKIISGAVSERKDEAEKIQRQRKEFEEKLKKQKEEAQQVEQIYKKSVAALMSAFAEELDKRCCYEVALGDTDSSLLDSADLDTYRDLVDKSIACLAPTLSRLQMRRADVGPSLKEMMDERVCLYERNVLNHGSEDNG